MADDADSTLAANSSDLSSEKRQTLIQFQEIVAIEDEEEALRILELHNWNLEVAVQSTFNENEGLPAVYNNQPLPQPLVDSSDDSPSRTIYTAAGRPQLAPGQSAVDRHRQDTWLSWLGRAAFFPFTITHAGYSFCYHCISEIILFFIRIVSPNFRKITTEPIDDILKFKKEYEETYGSIHPTFYEGSYSQVLADAKKELKFLLVYLHCKQHQSTPNFCHTVLSNPGFKEYINGNMLFWGCDINTNEGYKVSRAMRETMYPFLAIVCLRDNRMTIVWRIEGFVEVDELISVCAQVIDENEASLVSARSERQERSYNQELRDDQDTAYEASLAKDREKEKQKQEQLLVERRSEELRTQKEDEIRRKAEELVRRREACRNKISELLEPCTSDPDAIQIRIKLPNGRQLQRYFLKSNQLQILYDFVLSFDDSPCEFLLNTNFPRKSFPSEAGGASCTLADRGINAPTTFFVQNLLEGSSDEDSD